MLSMALCIQLSSASTKIGTLFSADVLQIFSIRDKNSSFSTSSCSVKTELLFIFSNREKWVSPVNLKTENGILSSFFDFKIVRIVSSSTCLKSSSDFFPSAE